MARKVALLILLFVLLSKVIFAQAIPPPVLLYTLVNGVLTAANGSGSAYQGGNPPSVLCYGLNGSGQVTPCVFNNGNIPGGVLGSVPYQSAPSTTAFVSPNTSASTLCFTQTGTGSVSAAPVWGACSGSAATAFSAITGSTNTSAAMVIGTGASMTVSGTGTNNATSVNGNTFPASGALTSGGLIYGSSASAYASDADFTISSHTLSSGASGLLNLSAITSTAGFKVPVAAGETATAAGVIDFDSTNNNYHGYVNGADSLFLNIASAPTSTHMLYASVSSGNTIMTDAGYAYNAIPLNDIASGSAGVGTYDFSGSTQLKVPVAANYTSAANGELGYDSNNLNFHIWQNAADNFVAVFPVGSPPTTGHCVEFLKSTNSWSLEDSGTACGTGTTTNALTMNNSGSGASSGTTFNGGSAVTLSYNTLGAPGLAATTNTFTGTTNDFSGTTQIKLPVTAGYTSAANGELGYDTTNKNWHIWGNAADNITVMFPAASIPTNGHCADWSVSSNVVTLADAGSACGSGGGISFPQTVSGTTTSGGIVYFSSATQISSSSAGTTNAPILWGGAGTAPGTGHATDNGTVWAFTEGATISPSSTSQVGLIVNNPSSTSVDILDLENNTTKEFTFSNAGLLTALTGLATGSSPPSVACGSATGIWCAVEASTAGTPTTGDDYIRASSATHQYIISLNDGAEFISAMNLPYNAIPASDISSGTNTQAAIVISTGASIAVSGSGTNQATSLTTLSGLPSEAANTVVGNGTSSSASPTALTMPSCSGTTNALIWTAGTGFGCNSITTSGVALSSITQASASNTIANGNNPQAWNWAQTTNSQTAFSFGETSAATGTGDVELAVSTASGSTATPLLISDSLSGSQTLAALKITPTWNTTGVVDAAILVNVTNTASGSGSLLEDLQVGGSSEFKVDKAGNLTTNGGATITGLTTAGLVTATSAGVLGSEANATIAQGGTNAISAAAGTVPNATSSSAASWTATPILGVAGTTAGTLTTANGSASASTVWGSAATTTNTILGPATVVSNGDLMYCAVSSTTCTLTDTGYAYNSIPNADLAHSSVTYNNVTVALGSSGTINPPLDKSTYGLSNPTASATFSEPAGDTLTLNGTAPASSGSTGTAGTSIFVLTDEAGGATTGSATTAGAGASTVLTAGVGGSGSSGTNAKGGAGGGYTIAGGGGGASSGTAANSNGGNITLTPGAAGTGGSGAAGTAGVVIENGVTLPSSITSGGIPYGSASNTLASSAALASTALVVGGGAGGAPTTGNGDFTYSTHTLAGGASGILDISAETGTAAFKVPSNSSNTATAAGVIDYDTSNSNYHGYNGADSIFPLVLTSANPTNNDCVKWSNSSGKITLADAGAACGSGGGSSALSSITAATGSNTIASGNNSGQVWNWALTANSETAFTFGETNAATSGTLGNQYILQAQTLSGSTAVPFNITESLSGSQTLPAIYVTPTWNTTGVVDAAILLNVTNTASGTGSKLLDLQVGGTTEFNTDKAGNGTFATSVGVGTVPTCTAGSGGGLCMTEGSNITNVSSTAALDANSTTHELAVATNGSTSFGMLERAQPGSINSTGNTASISTATLCAASAGACNQAGLYHVHVVLYQSGTACTTANVTGGVSISITWTDGNGTSHSAQTMALQGNSLGTNAIGWITNGVMLWGSSTSSLTSWASGDMNIATNGTVIQYATTYSNCSAGGTATYVLNASVTRTQ